MVALVALTALAPSCGGLGGAPDTEATGNAPSAIQVARRPFVLAGGNIDLHFTRPGVSAATGEDPEADDAIVAGLDSARTSIDASVFEFTRQNLIDALLRAHQRGVRVRFAGDGDEADHEGYHAMAQAGVPLALRKPGDRIMHNKFAVVDGTFVFTGSMNWSENDVMLNNNTVVKIVNPALVAAYQAEFEQMWAKLLFGNNKLPLNTPKIDLGGGNTAEIFFTPSEDAVQGLRNVLAGAKSRVLFMIFSFTHTEISDDMIALHNRGVKVAGVFDQSQADGRYSVDTVMAKAGVPVFIDGNKNSRGFAGGKVHHKVLIVDPGTPDATVITGSFNWSKNAATQNDENMIILRGAQLVDPFVDQFASVAAVATPHPDFQGAFPDVVGDLLQLVRINEVLGNPDGVDNDEEYVELVNAGGSSVDISGWSIGDIERTNRHVFPTATAFVLRPGERVVVFSGVNASEPGRIIASSGQLSLNNPREDVSLFNKEGELVDKITYRDAVSGVSFNRVPDGGRDGDLALHTTLSARPRSPGSPAVVRVIVNEVMSHPAGDGSDDEYIELVNAGTADFDLSGYTLFDGTAVRHVFAVGTTLRAGASIVVFGGGDRSRISNAVTASTGSLGLANGGSTLRLRNAATFSVDTATLTTATAGVSWNRSPDGTPGASFALHTTVAGVNGSAGTIAGPLLRINEALLSAEAGEEFIEIVNAGGAPQDLTGFQLGEVVSKSRHVFDGVTLPPGGRIAVFEDGRLGPLPVGAELASSGALELDASGETITLRDPQGVKVDEVTLPTATAGVSWNRSPDGAPTGGFALHTTLGTSEKSSAGTTIEALLRINEVHVHLEPGEHAFVEIVNAGGKAASLDSVTFGNGGALARYAFPSGISLEPSDRVVVYDFGYPFAVTGTTLVAPAPLSLTAANDAITLRDAQGRVADEVVYGFVPTGTSLVRETDGAAAGPMVPHDLVSGAFTSPGLPSLGRLVIHEVMLNPEGSDGVVAVAANEYIEVANVGGEEMDLAGVTLSDADGVRHVFGARTLQPGEMVVVFASPTSRTAMPTAVTASSGTLSLGNATEMAVLRDDAGDALDALRWTVAGTDGVSLHRRREGTALPGFVPHTTLSSAKGSPGTQIRGRLLINEVHHHPTATANTAREEYVEIVNVGGEAISLAGLVLRDSASARHTFASVTLTPFQSIVVAGGVTTATSSIPGVVFANASGSTLSLNNDGDTVRLTTAAGATLDVFEYDDSLNTQPGARGTSFSRAIDGHAWSEVGRHDQEPSAAGRKATPGRRSNGTGWPQ